MTDHRAAADPLVAALIEEYADAFSALDVERVLTLYDVPSTIVSGSATVTFTSVTEARQNLTRLMDSYRAGGFRRAEPVSMDVESLGDRCWQVDVSWLLHTSSAPIGFRTRYWLVDRAGLRIAAVLAYEERPQG